MGRCSWETASNLGVAMAGRVLVGLGVFHRVRLCNYKLLAEWFEPKRFIIMGGLFQAVGGIGALSAGAPLALASESLGWRATLVVIGGATLVMAGLVWLFVRNPAPGKGLAAHCRRGRSGRSILPFGQESAWSRGSRPWSGPGVFGPSP